MLIVPLTAVHAEFGLLDATLPDLGGTADWAQVHRAKPPAPLTCRACAAPMTAKESKLGMRFFAHRAAVSDCPTVGETIAHRLLKIELAAAIRDAGWHAELEEPGNGWRADVLATSPDGRRRVAWEAQLAAATIEDLSERTATMAADGVEVCWVTDKDTTWVTHVPSARVHRPDDAEAQTPASHGRAALLVVDGHARFEPDWCRDRERCDSAPDYGQRRVPCPGHGRWLPAKTLTLAAFVRAVCAAVVGLYPTHRPVLARQSRHDSGTSLWTTRQYRALAEEQRTATETYTSC